MSVAFRVESGDDGRAIAALLPQIIGNIQTATGVGTIRRAIGIAFQATAGDSVCRGDVIETMADGRIAIRFIDGTTFNLSPGSRLTLDDFVCDAGGTSHSALFGVTRGTFAFMAGRVAKTGCLTIDTPVGSIVGRAYGSGFGMLSLTALTFSMISDARAADPDTTIVDNDIIAYKDLDQHGVFELVTKEPIPRHILVEDPGVTVVLRPRGSTISVNQVPNSAARMEELQAAQQDVLANYAKGLGPPGSSTPPGAGSLPVQRINFIQSTTATEQDSLPPLPLAPPLGLQALLVHIPPPPPSPPTLTAATGPIEFDTAVFDSFTATSGTFVASSPRGDALVYGINGGTAGSTTLAGVIYDVSRTGPYGTLYLSSTTGAYTFVPDAGPINALTTTALTNFTITVSDGTLSASQAFTVIIHGVNDAAIISGTNTGTVIEAGGALPGTPTVAGTLTDIDVDNPANTFTAVGPTVSDAGYGTFTMTVGGVWTYTLNNANNAVQALGVTGSLTDTFTVTTVDGTAKQITITITGNNDTAVISGTATGTVIEAGGLANAGPGTPTTTGTLTDIDIDNPLNTFTAVGPTTSDAGYGTFTMTVAGVWTYTLDNANSSVQALNAGGTLIDTFTVTTIDGTAAQVTITITGSNDIAIISGTTTGLAIEAGGIANSTPGTPTATGTLVDADLDNPLNTFTAVGPTASDAGYGRFTMTAAGVWTYTLDNTNGAVQALNVNGTLTDTFTVTTIDGTATLVTITIAGSNDAAIISGTATGLVIEAGGVANATPGAPTATGTLTDADLDNPLNTFTAVGPAASDNGYGSFTMTAAGVWTYTLDNANSAVQALNVGNALTDTFTVTSIDGTARQVTITITGSNDAAIISGTATGSVTEAGGLANAAPGTPTATGTLTDTDVDNPANTFTAVSTSRASAGGYGSFTMTAAGVWTYTLDNGNGAVQALNVGSALTDTFTVTTIDGTARQVTITITGSNDAAIISGTATGSVIEAGGIAPGTPTTTGTLTDTDVDNPFNTFTAVTTPRASTGGYGTFTMTAAGVWAYTLDNDNSVVEALGVGDTLTDTFTVTTVDGTAKLVTITINGASDADPNDFDNLAPGPEVVTDPPFVFGTPGGENIAGGGNDGQTVYAGAGNDTVNGTGKDDILYAGSGNDTVKGNGGDDTIYGGSGSDDINGNNDNDTIIGGFGADQLTGSNGNDRFVYLSAMDSRANLFDIITDFASGSDKIDLATLGAFAFLALTSTSTSVPPHTIAWIYDSASNQTIVYVNPTDQTLSIGSSSLLEIHLQGVATVEASDFVVETAAATQAMAGDAINPELIAMAEADATVLAMTIDRSDGGADAKVQTVDLGFSFDTDRRWFDFSEARFTSPDEEQTPSTEAVDGNAAVIPEKALQVVPHHVHDFEPAANDSGPAPVLHNASATSAHDGAGRPSVGTIQDTSIAALTVPGERTELPSAAHGHAPSHSQGSAGSKANAHGTPDGESDSGGPGNDGQPVARSVGHSGDQGSHGTAHSSADDTSKHGNAAAHDAHTPSPPAHGRSSSADDAGTPGPGPVAHSGNPGNHGAAHSVPDDTNEHGNAPAHSAHMSAPPAHGRSNSPHDAGTPGPVDSFHFRKDNPPSGNSDVIELADNGHASDSTGRPAHAGGPDKADAIGPSPPGQSDDHLPGHAANAHHGHDPHDLMV